MRTIFLTLMLTFFFGSLLTVEAQTGREIRVRINQQKAVSGTRLNIKFIAMVEDSRCPTDANCIWAGNAKIKIRISKNGKAAKTFELNSNLAPPTVVFEGHEFKLTALTPAPSSNIRINRNGYIATLSVRRL